MTVNKVHWTIALNKVLRQLLPRKIAPPPTPKLILSQTLTLTGGQFSSWGIVWLPPNPKTNSDLDPNPNPNRGEGNFPLGAIVRIHHKTIFSSFNLKLLYCEVVWVWRPVHFKLIHARYRSTHPSCSVKKDTRTSIRINFLICTANQ